MSNYQPEKVIIDQSAFDNPRTKRILAALPSNIPVSILEGPVKPQSLTRHDKDPRTSGKKILHIGIRKGNHQFKQCPGVGDHFLCCNYWVINVVENCHFECSYCFLQSYLSSPLIHFYVNLEDIFTQLDEMAHSRDPKNVMRVGTGELSDSLGLEHIHGFSQDLIQHFRTLPKTWILELKTKSNNVTPILGLDHRQNVVISWSLSPEATSIREEKGTASTTQRLMAAKKASESGYRVSFHLDPMIVTEDWRSAYSDLVDAIFDTVGDESIAWISMGSLRLNPGLYKVIHDRHPESTILDTEYIIGPDKKMKYPRTIREEMFKTIEEKIKRYNPSIVTYLCMEGVHTWGNVYDEIPSGPKRLDQRFAKRLSGIGLIKNT